MDFALQIIARLEKDLSKLKKIVQQNEDAYTNEDYDMLARENKAFADYLSSVHLSDDAISKIANGGKPYDL